MLEHADRNDAVEWTLEITVIGHLEAGAIAQLAIGGALIGDRVLLGRQGDTKQIDVEVSGNIEPHAAPAAADIKYLLTRFQRELRGNMALLGKLRLFERGFGRRVIGTGILQVVIQEEPVELA